MKLWTVELSGKAHKQMKNLPPVIRDLARKAIKGLECYGPKPPGWNVKKLDGHEYRLRLHYRYRLHYHYKDGELLITIFYLGHRKDAYKKQINYRDSSSVS